VKYRLFSGFKLAELAELPAAAGDVEEEEEDDELHAAAIRARAATRTSPCIRLVFFMG
jgi:hypothetical protein